MINFILGSSGSGKTHYIKEQLEKLALQNTEKLYLIVPEQSSYTMERSILEDLGEKTSRKIEIISFTRMVDMVMRKVGGIAGRRISGGEKRILMSLALEECASSLDVYGEKAKHTDLTEIMLKTAERLKLLGIHPNKLSDAAVKTGDKLFSKKLTDTALIFNTYNALVQKSYVDPSDDMERLYNVLLDYPFFKDSIVFIDGFSGFTKGELDIIEQIIKQSKECFVSLCMNSDSNEKFGLTQATYRDICNIANKISYDVGEIIEISSGKRFKSKELALLEENIFSENKKTYDGEVSNVYIYRAKNIYEECDIVASQIRRLVTEENYRYRDIVLISRLSEPYRGILDVTLDKYDIPCFADYTQAIDTSALMIAVLSLLDTVNNNFNIEYFMRLLKSGLTNIPCDDVSVLENYVLMWNLKGSDLLKEFSANPLGFGSEETKQSAEQLLKLNDIRKKAIEPLIKFKNAIKDANGIEISKHLYSLINEIGIKDSLEKIIKELEDNYLSQQAGLQQNLWEILMQSLDYIAYVYHEKEISPKRYSELLRLVINSADIGSIPKGFDTVTFGTADRIRTDSPKIVFLLGANDGEFPMPPKHNSLFSLAECSVLSDLGLKLYDDVTQLNSMETFFAYTAISAPKEKLYVSHHEAEIKGELKKPSIIVNEIKHILKNIKEYCISDFELEELLWAEKPAFEFLAQTEPHSRLARTLTEYFESKDEYKRKLKAIEDIRNKSDFKINDEKVARKLFGADMYVSPSQVEKYHLCPFMYFCMYGLRAKERKKAELDYMEYGSLVHSILENIFINNKDKGLHKLSYDQIREDVLTLAKEYIEKYMGGMEDKSPRFEYLCHNLCENVIQLVLKLSQEFSTSLFTPDAFEMTISKDGDISPYTLKMEDGTSINIIGKIDRVDTYKKDGNTYLRVVDYKTGSKEFILADVIHGLNMQMLLYLSAVYKNGTKRYESPLPAGILYMPASVKNMTVSPDTSKEQALEFVADELRMNGLLIDNYEVLKAMESDLTGRFIPVIMKELDENELPVYKNKDSLVTSDELTRIFKSIDITLLEMAGNLKEGRINNIPIKGAFDACTYCAYASVCGFEEGDKCKNIKRGKRGIPEQFKVEEG